MSLISKDNANRLKKEVLGVIDPRGAKLSGTLYHQFNELHSVPYTEDKDIELLLVKQKMLEIDLMDKDLDLPENMIRFSPSGASKCERELFYRALKSEKDARIMFPYQKRWTRNSTAVHEAVQRDILYMGKVLPDPKLTISKTKDGLPAWEGNIKAWKEIEHKGEKFILLGMMDGILDYHPENIKIGFEFKTKSTTIAQVGTYKMKGAQDSHKIQCVAYSILFDLDEFIIMYESVAKDNWMENENAKPDIRTFYHKVTDEDRMMLLDKFAEVTKMVRNEQIPEGDKSKCIFCEYKSVCRSMGDVA